jgi:hypothetical protein
MYILILYYIYISPWHNLTFIPKSVLAHLGPDLQNMNPLRLIENPREIIELTHVNM